MKKSFFAVAVALVAGFASAADQYDIRPEAKGGESPTAVAWQNANDAKLAAATKPVVLAGFVSSDAAADALLARIKGAYETDPVVMTQIACVTQLVLCPKCDKAPAFRQVWVAALKRKIASTRDKYVQTFCRQQLWLCE